jgi:hypothetical protein
MAGVELSCAVVIIAITVIAISASTTDFGERRVIVQYSNQLNRRHRMRASFASVGPCREGHAARNYCPSSNARPGRTVDQPAVRSGNCNKKTQPIGRA